MLTVHHTADDNDTPYLSPENVVIVVPENWPLGVPAVNLNFSDQDKDLLHYNLSKPSPYVNVQDLGGLYPIVRPPSRHTVTLTTCRSCKWEPLRVLPHLWQYRLPAPRIVARAGCCLRLALSLAHAGGYRLRNEPHVQHLLDVH